MATLIQRGDSVDYTPGADVAAGAVVVQEDLVGVAGREIKTGTLGALAVTGVYEFPKETGGGKAIPAGKKVYWDATPGIVKKGSAGATYLGKAAKAAAEDDATVQVRLEQ